MVDEIPDPSRAPCSECGYFIEYDDRGYPGCLRPRKANEAKWDPADGWTYNINDFAPNSGGHCPFRIPRLTFWQRVKRVMGLA